MGKHLPGQLFMRGKISQHHSQFIFSRMNFYFPMPEPLVGMVFPSGCLSSCPSREHKVILQWHRCLTLQLLSFHVLQSTWLWSSHQAAHFPWLPVPHLIVDLTKDSEQQPGHSLGSLLSWHFLYFWTCTYSGPKDVGRILLFVLF